jgi:hypothetical protein
VASHLFIRFGLGFPSHFPTSNLASICTHGTETLHLRQGHLELPLQKPSPNKGIDTLRSASAKQDEAHDSVKLCSTRWRPQSAVVDTNENLATWLLSETATLFGFHLLREQYESPGFLWHPFC